MHRHAVFEMVPCGFPFFVRRLQGLEIRAWHAHLGGYERLTNHRDLLYLRL